MDGVFKFIIDARKAFIELIDGLSIEDVNRIPEGFNNNIIWNFGHIVVSTQTLSYVRTGIWPDKQQVKFVHAYEKGSRPSYFVDAAEIDELKELSITTILKIEEDYKKGLFDKIQSYQTATYGALLQDIEAVLITSIGHDSLHFGYAQAQQRIIRK
ncbi:DinB family protein [Olivibacter sp. CPCC 100613]|uniref:DinB family protein n=1 Tax=Olivibacter sp. CPCC 100613 TaxID=3079931 RepID=UPI002FFB94F1